MQQLCAIWEKKIQENKGDLGGKLGKLGGERFLNFTEKNAIVVHFGEKKNRGPKKR